MEVTATLFGGLRSEASDEPLSIDLHDGDADVQSLLDELGRRFPTMRPRLSGAVCAIADEIVDYDHPLKDGDEVGVLPPVSGG